MSTIRFSHAQIQEFAAYSGDTNPLHTDAEYARRTHFGRCLVHGMLGVRTVLSHVGTSRHGAHSVDIEFRGAMTAGADYTLDVADGGTTVRLLEAGTTQLLIRRNPALAVEMDLEWLPSVSSAPRHEAAPLELEDLFPGRQVAGTYSPSASTGADSGLDRVLALCSYIVGMEMPGERALFTRASVICGEGILDARDLVYRATLTRVDRTFRLVDVRVDVATPDGCPVAAADLRAYVRFTPAAGVPDPLSIPPDIKNRLKGRVAVVSGGTRGLGAEITAALAAAGCRVYATYRSDRAAAEELARRLAATGADIRLMAGSAEDPAFAAEMRDIIRAAEGRLDLLVLNACAPPVPMPLDGSQAGTFGRYVGENLALAEVPAATLLPLLRESGGTICAISSSFVTERPQGFAHYVALKQAVEGLVHAATAEARGLRALVVRPPRLLTTWNDTPAGVIGAIAPSTVAAHLVRRFAAQEDTHELLSDFPALSAETEAAGESEPDFTIGLNASFTAEPILPGLKFWFRELGLRGEVEVAPYGQVIQTLLGPGGGLTRRPGMHVVLLRAKDWLRELDESHAASETFVGEHLASTAAEVERAIRSHRAHAASETLVVFCPSDASEPHAGTIRSVERGLAQRLTGVAGLTVVDATAWHESFDVDAATIADQVREHIAHIPYKPAYYHVLATIVMRHVHRKLVPARKVVVVDCDNTLWRGVVGEAGAEGVQFDPAHTALHARLARLAQSGVLIALCSKNEEADVLRVFDTRPELGFRREQVVCAMVNWEPKSQNLKAMAARLNLGLDSFVFIDDNPVECAEVRAACPEVLTLEWPHDNDRALQLLAHTWELDPRGATAEDQRRTELYKEEFRRQELQAQTLSFREFIDSLGLEVDISPLSPADVMRASQLTLRTNQFNFTTRRRGEAELQALAGTGVHEIRTVRVRDRFGDYGLVGLLVAEISDREVFADTLLLSCRVLGRGVEHHMVNELGRIAAARGVETVRLRVEPTRRNTPARSFLESLVPAETLSSSAGAVEAILDGGWAARVTFEPPDHAAPAVTDDGSIRTIDAGDGSGLRSREQQIERTAYVLSSVDRLSAAIDPAARPRTPAATASVDAAAFVEDAFAKALGIDAGRVREIDSLEALGCDSFRIVEITVTLLERFPALPATLLFEHRSISEIVAKIAALSVPDREGASAPAPAVRATAEQPPAAADIAVVGLHLRCAGARSPEELWDLLSTGGVAVRPVPVDRPFFFGSLHDDRPHFAGLVDDIDGFEPELFGITPREAELMDPQLRLFLEVAWNALEDAGALGNGFDPDTGVFAGVMYSDYAHRANLVARHGNNPLKSWEGFSLANRLSQVFGFRGPSLAVDTACSSSGTAIHLACRALKAGDCKVAVVGGVNLILDPDRFVQLGRLGILSPSGRCLAFGAEADGTVLGEGAGVVVLRPLAAAVQRGDRIYGVIKATGVSTGSGTVGFTAPNPQAQADAIRRAVHTALVDPRTISYVETHGTGTALGDPIEVRGLSLGYGDRRFWDETLELDQRCAIGSIKPNIGHLEAGAGVLGLIKILLQMQRGMLLPSVTSEEPNPQISFDQAGFCIQRSLTAWNRDRVTANGATITIPRRAALNSFGVGGANAHVIVEEPPTPAAPSEEIERPEHLLVLSARTEEALDRRVADMARALSSFGDSLADLCFSANTGLPHLDRRVAVSAANRDGMIAALEALAQGEEPASAARGAIARSNGAPKVAFLFTGQGSQYAGMGRDLYDAQPVFRAALDQCFELFEPLLDRSLRATMFADADSPEGRLLDQTGSTQPALFALGYALSRMWRSWGVTPDVVLGHSVGEITAMCVAGGLSLEDAVSLIAARGRLMQGLPEGGAMTSVMTAESRVLEALTGYEDRVAVAAINGPAQVVISGEGTAVATVAARLGSKGVRTRDLAVSHAFHSPLMRPMLGEYESVARGLRFSPPQVAFVSCVLGRAAASELTDAAYWVRNVIDPVRFTDGIRAVESMGVTTFMELGPQPILIGMGRQTLGDDESRQWLASLRKDAAPLSTLLPSLGRLYVTGVDIDWYGFDAPWRRQRVSLPAYPFSKKRFWIDSRPVAGSPAVTGPAPLPAPGAKAYELSWTPQGSAAPSRSLRGTAWLVIGPPDDPQVTALARCLESAGAKSAMAWDAQVSAETLRGLDGVIYLPAQDAGEADRASGAIRLCESAAAVMHAIAGAGLQPMPRLFIVTRGAVSTGMLARPVDPGQAALWGAGRTFALEHAAAWGGLIDIGTTGDPDSRAMLVLRELAAGSIEDQIAFVDGVRHVPRLRPKPIVEERPFPIAAGRTYLVTGGLGALGLHVATWLVQRGAQHVVLGGRRGLQTPGAEAVVRALQRNGATVDVVKADTSSPAGIDLVLSAVNAAAPLAGVFHAAGVDETKPIAMLRPGDMARVMSGKVLGAWLLHERTRHLALDCFVLFSSIASVLGSAQRVAYAAANAFIDALAHERRGMGLPALSVNWGPWAGGGMASSAALEQYARVGNRGIEPPDGVRLLDALIAIGAGQSVVADIDWSTFHTAYAAQRPRPLIAELLQPSLSPERQTSRTRAPWLERLASVPATRRLEELTALLRVEVAQTLGFSQPTDVAVDRPFRDMGMDSLMSADFAQRLQKRLAIRGASVVFEHPTVNALAAHLLAAINADADARVTSHEGHAHADHAPTAGRTERYRPGIEIEAIEFQKRAWPSRRPELIPARWNWMFLDSARRTGVPPAVWLHRREGMVVGHNGAIPVNLKTGAAERTAAWLVDTMVLEEYRSQAAGAQLMMEAHEDIPLALSLGQTAQMRAIQLKLGWEQVAPLQTAQLLIRPERVLQGKLPRPAAAALGFGLRASNALRQRSGGEDDWSVRPVDRFDTSHDRLWTLMAAGLTCAVRRDASYLNWKYVDQPGQDFLRLELRDRGVPRAVFVCMFREPDDHYRYRRAFLVDVVAPLDDRPVLDRVVDAAVRTCAAGLADSLTCLHIDQRITRALIARGFRLRAPERYLLVRPGGLDAATRSVILRADSWLVTHGDSDIDRPW